MLAEPLAVTLQVVDVLDRLDAPYWIGGSLASSLHGVARATLDSDMVADRAREHVGGLTRALEESFFSMRDGPGRHPAAEQLQSHP